MGIVFRQSIKGTLINIAGALLGALIVFLSTKFLATAQYGFNKNIINIGAVAQVLVSLGCANALFIFTPRYSEYPQKRNLFFTLCLLVPTVVIILLSIPYFLFQKQLIDIYKLQDRFYVVAFYFFVPVLVWLWCIMTTLEHYLLSQVRVAVTSFFKEIVLRLVNIALLILFICKIISFYTFISGIVFSYAIAALGLAFIIMRSREIKLSLNWGAFSIAEYHEISKFSWYHLLIGISMSLMGFIDALILAPIKGMSAVAIYTTAIYIVTLVYIPYRAMSLSAFAILNKVFLEADLKKLNEFFHRSAVNILIVAVAMVIIISCNLPNAALILPAAYQQVVPISLILLIGRLIDMATGLNTELISISQHYKIAFRLSAALIIVLVALYLIFIPQYGIYGAAWCSTLALGLYNIGKMYVLWQKFRIQPFSRNTLLILLAGIIPAVAGVYMPG